MGLPAARYFSAMHFRMHRPTGALGTFVEYFWCSQSAAGVAIAGAQFPEGGVTVLFCLGPRQGLVDPGTGTVEWFATAWVAGERKRPYHLTAPEGADLVGIHFRPGGAYPFFRLPLSELTDRVIPLDIVWDEVEPIRGQLDEASPSEQFAVLARALEARLAADRVPSGMRTIDTVGRLAGWRPGASIRDLAEDIGVSQRQLLRLFTDRVGLGPKGMHRVLRFQRLIRLVDVGTRRSWTHSRRAADTSIRRTSFAISGCSPGSPPRSTPRCAARIQILRWPGPNVSPGLLETLGLPIVRGRTNLETDIAGAEGVALVDQAFVDTYLPDADPLRSPTPVAQSGPGRADVRDHWGVGDTKHLGLDDDPKPRPGPGSYRVRSERIGYRAWESVPLNVRTTATYEVNPVVHAIPRRLATITVADRTSCQVDKDPDSELFWEEARKALVAASWSAEQDVYRHRIHRFDRESDASRERRRTRDDYRRDAGDHVRVCQRRPRHARREGVRGARRMGAGGGGAWTSMCSWTPTFTRRTASAPCVARMIAPT